jgi:hypothetical protein
MDQAFFLRAKRLLDRQKVAPTHQALLAHLADQRAACPTVQACGAPLPVAEGASEADALTALILAEPGWRIAARIQRGCFNRAAAARPVNTV